jgi:WD repeat-containing protein 35
VAAGNEGFVVGRDSGEVNKYSLPYIQLQNKFTLRCKPQTIVMNNDCTKLAIVDINGVLTFFDTEACPPGSRAPGYHLPQEKKEVWSVIWSSDEPNLCAIMEKNRLYVMRDFEAEEPVLTPGYLCDFTDLEVKAVLLDDILKAPEDIKTITEMIVKYECKSLRDTRDHLASISLKDAISYVEENTHPRLWKLICETALEKLDFEVAGRAFVKL